MHRITHNVIILFLLIRIAVSVVVVCVCVYRTLAMYVLHGTCFSVYGSFLSYRSVRHNYGMDNCPMECVCPCLGEELEAVGKREANEQRQEAGLAEPWRRRMHEMDREYHIK